MALGASIGLSVILHFFGRYVYMLFTTDAQVIEIGMQILYFLTPIYFTYVTIEVISGTVRSMGFVFTPMLMTCMRASSFMAVYCSSAESNNHKYFVQLSAVMGGNVGTVHYLLYLFK